MLQMEYKENRHEGEILANGVIDGFAWCIVSYGSHPCAYIVIPEGHKYYKVTYYDTDILCHGGITYGQFGLHEIIPDNYWVIGWDYAHGGDYMGYYMQLEQLECFDHDNKKWTTEEIFEHVKDVIEQLKGVK